MYDTKHFFSLYELLSMWKSGQSVPFMIKISDMLWQTIFYADESAVSDMSSYVRC